MIRGKQRFAGYTVVEVLIFLAVTAGLFVAAASVIGGQQARTEFSTAVKEFELKIGDIVNNVSTGYYPSLENFSCSAGNSGGPALSTTPADQGTNGECVYLGRAIQFAPDGVGKESYRVYTLIGRRLAPGASDEPIKNLTEAMPRLIARATAEPANTPDNSELLKFGGGLSVQAVQYLDGGAYVDVGGIALASSIASTGFSSGISNGNITTRILVPDASLNTSLGQDPLEFVQKFNSISDASVIENPDDGVRICLNSGTTKQYVWVYIGRGSAGALTTSTEVFDGECADVL